jgi:hypothetical protein
MVKKQKRPTTVRGRLINSIGIKEIEGAEECVDTCTWAVLCNIVENVRQKLWDKLIKPMHTLTHKQGGKNLPTDVCVGLQ